MQEKPGTRKVYVKADMNVVIGSFGGEKRKAPLFDKFVAVELTDYELKLTGSAFITAARKALLKTLTDNEVTLINGNCELNEEGMGLSARRQQLGFVVHPDNILLTDKWVAA